MGEQQRMRTIVAVLFSAALAMGASLPATQIQGDYVEARNAEVFVGPCYANSETGLVGDLAVFGWRITKGSFEGVSLDGLSVVGVVKASSTLGDVNHSSYPIKSILIVDENASVEQRMALRKFAKRMSNDLLSDVVRVDYAPVSLTFANNSVHSMQATLKAGELAAIRTRAINDGDKVCSHEEPWYEPLTKLDHAMPTFTIANDFRGAGLGTTWKSPDKSSSFVGNFHLND
jgi:hypothetical protein